VFTREGSSKSFADDYRSDKSPLSTQSGRWEGVKIGQPHLISGSENLQAGAPLNSHQIDRREIRERFIQSQRSEVVSFSDLVMGGLMALAGIVAIDVLSGPSDNFFRAVMWLGSVTTVWTVYDVRRHGSIYEIARVRTFQRTLARLNSIVHFGLFAFLANSFLSHKFWAYWCAAMGLHCVLSIALVFTGSSDPTRSFAPDAASLGELIRSTNTRRGIWVVVYAVTGTLLAAFAFFAPPRFDALAKMLVAGFAFACVVIDFVLMREEDVVLDKVEELAHSQPN
jgi:hypothetical protein